MSKSGRYPLQAPFVAENVETKNVVLVHGEGFGAWCWYKSISLLEEAGLLPIALDLTGSGIDKADANCISTLAEYSKPLIDYLHNLPDDEKVRIHMDISLYCIYIQICSVWAIWMYVIRFALGQHGTRNYIRWGI